MNGRRRIDAARARWSEDISRVDAYSSSASVLALLWHSSELHCQLAVHSHREPSLGGEAVAAQGRPRHGEDDGHVMIGQRKFMASKASTLR